YFLSGVENIAGGEYDPHIQKNRYIYWLGNIVNSIFNSLQSTYDHRVWKTGLPVRSAVLKPHAGELVVGWVTTSESSLLYVFAFAFLSYSLLRKGRDVKNQSCKRQELVWKIGLPVRSAVLKPHAGELVVGWVTTSESSLFAMDQCIVVYVHNAAW
ncbi:hypothetical protein N7457_004009, partial [Penicillium paradoxum]|uniref:uncharacterized protein n=1 Tax=Penicillium paradoxum TaxID=176176 RepID=UPI002547F454